MDQALPDLIRPGLKILFCGINPGSTAARAGRHFVNGSNRFWRVLHLAGFTPEQIAPNDDRRILEYGYGLTTVIPRPTAGIADLARLEYSAARAGFEAKVEKYRPEILAFLGKSAWASLSDAGPPGWGPQLQLFAGSRVWVLPNPSGRNLHFTLDALVESYRKLRDTWLSSPG